VIEVVEQQDEPVILVGHSFGGITISEVAEAVPDQVEALVYVAAYIPRTGDSLAGLAELDHNNGFTEDNFLLAEDFTYAYVLESDFLTIFCGDCTEEQGVTVMATRQDEPLAPLNEPATVTEENFGSVRKVYIMTAEDNAASPQLQAFMISQTPVDHVYALNTSHVPFVTMPEELAALLIAAAEAE
jgi:pimeloyl-ACP methyl ester carboxylesterase